LRRKAKTLQSVTLAKARVHRIGIKMDSGFRRNDKKKALSGIARIPGWITSNQQIT
jgi:hypothetical protein